MHCMGNPDCTSLVERSYAQQCKHKRVTCSNCGEETQEIKLEDHLETACTGQSHCESCKGLLIRKDLKEHHKTCEHFMSPCRYQDVGCTFECSRKDLGSHEESCQYKIVYPLVREVASLKDYTSQLKRLQDPDKDMLRAEIAKLKKKEKDQEEREKDQEEREKDQEERIKNLEMEVRSNNALLGLRASIIPDDQGPASVAPDIPNSARAGNPRHLVDSMPSILSRPGLEGYALEIFAGNVVPNYRTNPRAPPSYRNIDAYESTYHPESFEDPEPQDLDSTIPGLPPMSFGLLEISSPRDTESTPTSTSGPQASGASGATGNSRSRPAIVPVLRGNRASDLILGSLGRDVPNAARTRSPDIGETLTRELRARFRGGSRSSASAAASTAASGNQSDTTNLESDEQTTSSFPTPRRRPHFLRNAGRFSRSPRL